MAGASFFAFFDDIAALMDDLAVMAQRTAVASLDDVAASARAAGTQTLGIAGDDLAVNVEQMIGINAKREGPIIWEVFKGSFINKIFLIIGALLISTFAPSWVIPAILILGGTFLCYEAAEKVIHSFTHDDKKHTPDIKKLQEYRTPEEIKKREKKKIKKAIKTDLILSAEIIAVALGSVAGEPLATQVIVLCLIGFGMTVGIYGLVYVLMKADDWGLAMMQRKGVSLFVKFQHRLGRRMVMAAPKVLKSLSVIGTAAMFMVGGGILMHNIPVTAEALHHLEHALHDGILAGLTSTLVSALAGAMFGGLLNFIRSLAFK